MVTRKEFMPVVVVLVLGVLTAGPATEAQPKTARVGYLEFGSAAPGTPHLEAFRRGLREYGWIDGQRKGFDGDYYLQRFTPRRPRSRWSKINREKATELIEKGMMRPAGLREVERAKADGRWDAAYDSPSTATVPDDLRRELERDPRAMSFFSTLNSANRYAILYQIQEARRPETRARRIEKYVAMLAEGKKLYP